MSTTMDQARHDDTMLFAGTAVNILIPAAATGGTFSLLRIAHPPGCWTPPHLHRSEDETVFVLSGTLRAETEEHATDVGPGQAIVLPRGQPHRLGNVGPGDARFLVLCTPGGFDGFVRAAGRSMPDGGPMLTEADVARLVWAAPYHDVELLAPDALRSAASASAAAVPPAEEIDVLGVRVQVFAELGSDEDDLCLIRGRVPPGVVVPLHAHADREVLYGLGGTTEVWTGSAGGGAWQAVSAGGLADVSGGAPHALRNRGDAPADSLLVTTRRIAGLFREIGCPVGAVPAGPPSSARLDALVTALHARGYWLASEAENAAFGLQPVNGDEVKCAPARHPAAVGD